MPSSTQSSKLQLPSSTPNLASLQSLNHALPIKLDRNNYILWKTRMENVFFANGFEEFIGRTKPCPSKELPTEISTLNLCSGGISIEWFLAGCIPLLH
ncbi:hypothetical protein CK203_105009 [Vitis vinifera]|uniref:Retrotransposon Copia-like N-terminal domain-containing protein n=1 Tax=Vitis vinifera TaxID=29760 RepID=A0A438BQP4_VITVI|nr:hypothetical protein CK203_105009 [Vitis vinifera]